MVITIRFLHHEFVENIPEQLEDGRIYVSMMHATAVHRCCCGCGMIRDHVSGGLSDLDREVVSSVPPGGNWRDLPASFASKRVEQIRASAARGEGSRSTYYGRLRSDRPSYTISTYFNRPGNGCFIHPEFPRLITIREAARLQGFPDGFEFFGEGRSRYVQVGNAVPPLLSYQLARELPMGHVADLFAGVGGMSAGFQWAGFPVVTGVDNDRNACEAFRRNHPETNVIEADLSDSLTHQKVMDGIRSDAGTEGVTVLVGGPPCQGFSTAGACRLDDPRNKLVFAFVRAVEILGPRYVLMENVAALMFRRGAGVLAEIRESLHALGFRTEVAIAHTEGYGVPQLRRRLILVGASAGDMISWPQPWLRLSTPGHFEFQPGFDHIREVAPPAVTVGEAIGDLPAETAASANEFIGYDGDATSRYQMWARGTLPVEDMIPSSGRVERAEQNMFALGAQA